MTNFCKKYRIAAPSMALMAFVAWPGQGRADAPTSQQAAAGAGDLGEIVVTARKRSEKLFDVPGPVSAISSELIETLRLRDARDYLTLIPSAYLDESDSSGTTKSFSIRGITTPNLFAEPGVALYIDDVFSNGFVSYPLQLHDIQRIEVERGPQGALYGRDAVGGAVNVISHAPSGGEEFGATVTYGSHERVELDAYANLPVSEKIALRFAAWGTDQSEGEYYNQYLHQYLDSTAFAGGRATAVITPSDALSLTLLVEHSQGDTAGTDVYFPGLETRTTILRDTQPTNSYSVTRYVANLEYEPGFGTFNLIVGGREHSLSGIEDTDLSASFYPAANLSSLGKEITNRQNNISSKSVELRFLSKQIGPINILAGVNYLDETASGDIETTFPGIVAVEPLLTGGFESGLPAELDIQNNQSLRSIAGYAEVTWTITPSLNLIADVRYSRDEKSDNFNFAPSPFLQAIGGLTPQSSNVTKDFYRLSPGGTLAWSPTDDLRVYGKIQTGFRAGGFNFNVGSVKDLPYNQETSENYEIGLKKSFSGFLAGPSHVAIDGYLLRQHSTLISALDFTQPGPLESYLVNSGESRTLGLEVEGSVTPIKGLAITANASYQDATFDSGTNAFGASIRGQFVPGVRKWTSALTASYHTPITDQIDYLANASYTFRSGANADLTSNLRYDSSNLINLSTGLGYGSYTARFFVKNLRDDRYRIAYAGFRDGITGQEEAEGRVFGVTLDAHF